MRKTRLIQANRCYHLISRIAHRAFFMDEEEKNRFVDLLFRAAFFFCIDLIGFCVMSNHIHIYIHLPNDRELTEDEIHARVCRLYLGSLLEEALAQWNELKVEDERLRAQPGGKVCPSDFDELKLAYQRRMFHPSEFMKTLKQHYTMSFNGRRKHTGTLWESRFSCRESKALTSDMSAISAYIDCNPVEAGICAWPTAYLWCSWTMAMGGNGRARKMYEFIYGNAAEDWKGIVELHERAIKARIGEIGEERRGEMRSGATKVAPAGVESVEAPERYAIQLERGKNDTAEKILELLRNQPMSAFEIGAAIGMKSRVRLITIYIKPMLERKLIEQTIPNSPRAPNQKYRLAS